MDVGSEKKIDFLNFRSNVGSEPEDDFEALSLCVFFTGSCLDPDNSKVREVASVVITEKTLPALSTL